MRAMEAAELRPRETPGKITQAKESKPEAGSQFSCTQKSSISSRPHQKEGMETPIMETLMTRLSRKEYCLIAEITPKESPRITANTTAKVASLTVFGKVCAMRVATFRFVA